MSRFYFFAVLLASGFWTLPAPSDAYIARSTGCHHNGTWYADKSLVPTVEKCLNCQCNKKTLVCRLKVCPEMPMPPPRGCVVVEKRNTCCPYLSCARLEAFYKIPITRRIIAYLDHYERESIDRVVNDNMLQRRSDDSEADLQVCVKNGTVYKSGSAMSSSNLCSYCYCIGGTEKCVKPKCMLPVEGCKPIFVDSTCCPVRYDCSAKTSGKSSQEVRYRKTSNKHFLRMSQRLQRNRGCTVNKQFYAEGQKMKSDPDKPCDICFCIRGSRRCAPKKCSPALKNCIPVVPKGQCCPSSYDCGSQRDYRRSHNSRQFNLFSLLFGKDDNKPAASNAIPAQYPHDRDPALTSGGTKLHQTHEAALEASSEKSIMDTIRESLEFIDGNTNHMLEDNADLVSMQANRENIEEAKSTTRSEASDGDVNTTTDFSFLDLILGETSDSPNTDNVTQTTAPSQNELSWVDILLGSEEDQQQNNITKLFSEDSSMNPSNVHRLDSDVDELGSNGEILVGAESAAIESPSTEALNGFWNIKKLNTSELNSFERNNKTNGVNQPNFNEKGQSVKNMSTSLQSQQTMIKPIPLHNLVETTTPIPFTSTESSNLLSVILDGISGILDADESKKNSSFNQTIVPSTKPFAQLPAFKPLPAQKTHTRINSKIASLVVSPPTIIINSNQTKNSTLKPLDGKPPKIESVIKTNTVSVTIKKMLTSTSTSTTTTTPKPTTTKQTSIAPITTTTSKPLIVKTNPSILETDPLDDSTEPTLPPSLPNLKIIPFLPTDAVEADKANSHEFFSGSPSLYEDSKLYPDISKHYETFAVDLDDENKAKYIYKFKVEGPDTESIPAVIPKAPTDSIGVDAFLNYDLTEKIGFSPPTKTEGGFVPKDILALDDGLSIISDFNKPQLNEMSSETMHLKDVTTTMDPLESNLTEIIEITTPDPFKDVIHTEPPPDLTRVVLDKESLEVMAKNLTHAPTEIDSAQSKHAFSTPIHFNIQLVSTPKPSEAEKLQLKTNNDNIGTLLDIFMKEGSDPSMESSTKSALPPFKRLPQTKIDHLSINTKNTTIKTTTESTKRMQSTTTVTKTTTSNETTKKFYRTKSTQGAGSKNRIKSSATRKPTAAPPFKDNKQKLNKITTPIHSSSTATASPTITATAQPTTATKATKTPPTIAVASAIKTTKPSISSPKPTKSTTVKIATNNATSTERTHNPFLMSPFDKLPFMDASFEIKRRAQNTTPAAADPTAVSSVATHTLERLDGLDAAYDVSKTVSSTTTTTTTSVHPPYASVNEKHSTSFSNGLIDPTGILKLAGCNIYGRMYRVGRIILELSSPCVECKCTETGVACGQLDC